jgi:hypothetical protein
VSLAGGPASLAGSRRALWVAVTDPDGRVALEVRAPGSGRLLRSVALPGGAVRDLAAGDRAAFAVARDGRLRLVTRDGRSRVVLRGAVSVAGDGRSEVWALQAAAGRLVRLHPVDGRVLAVARVGRRPARRASPVALTRDAAWVTGASPRRLIRVPIR